MQSVIRGFANRRDAGGTALFEGEPYRAGVSFFLVDAAPGAGPPLHRHPYPETWVIRSGRARFEIAGEEVEAGAGDVVVVEKDTPHRFEVVGPERLDTVCIHASERLIQENL
jgi:mannose-6-phosphate isomerase-like protein (cupin superfamily)